MHHRLPCRAWIPWTQGRGGLDGRLVAAKTDLRTAPRTSVPSRRRRCTAIPRWQFHQASGLRPTRSKEFLPPRIPEEQRTANKRIFLPTSFSSLPFLPCQFLQQLPHTRLSCQGRSSRIVHMTKAYLFYLSSATPNECRTKVSPRASVIPPPSTLFPCEGCFSAPSVIPPRVC